MIKTTFRFTASSDALADVSRGRYGDAGYVALVIVDGEQRPELVLPPYQNNLTVDAEEGSAVQIFLSYRDARGHMSPAREVRFRVRRHMVPEAPGELRISAVDEVRRISLKVVE